MIRCAVHTRCSWPVSPVVLLPALCTVRCGCPFDRCGQYPPHSSPPYVHTYTHGPHSLSPRAQLRFGATISSVFHSTCTQAADQIYFKNIQVKRYATSKPSHLRSRSRICAIRQIAWLCCVLSTTSPKTHVSTLQTMFCVADGVQGGR
jgi:hypothetical protein